MNKDSLDIVLNGYFKSPIEEAIGVTVKQIRTEFESANNQYTILIMMTHALLPNKYLYGSIKLDAYQFKEDTNLLVDLLERSFKMMTEETRKNILKEIDEILGN